MHKRRVFMSRTVLMVDPPGGWKHNFPKPCPKNWGLWAWDQKVEWFVENGYPRGELEKLGEFECSLYHQEIEETWLAGRANI